MLRLRRKRTPEERNLPRVFMQSRGWGTIRGVKHEEGQHLFDVVWDDASLGQGLVWLDLQALQVENAVALTRMMSRSRHRVVRAREGRISED